MIRNEHQTLWNGIVQFAFDDPGAAFSYADKLRQSTNWTTHYTTRVIDEYRKFIFLCMVLPGGASPPKAVDEAWHLHLTYTVNYWEQFCKNVLGKPLHHHPSRGGPEEKEKHIAWYHQTIEGYRYYFGQDPPNDIWPPPVSPDHPDPLPARKLLFFLLLFLPFLLPLCFGTLNPFHLRGPAFLLFYSILLLTHGYVLYASVQFIRQRWLEPLFRNYKPSLQLYPFLRHTKGKNAMVKTAAVELVAAGVLAPELKARFSVANLQPTESVQRNPALAYLQQYYQPGETVSLDDIEYMCSELSSADWELEEQLRTVYRKVGWWPWLLWAVTVLLGLLRIMQGIAREKPVLFLVVLVLAAAVLGYWYNWKHDCRKHFFTVSKDALLGRTELAAFAGVLPLAIQYSFFGQEALIGVEGYTNLKLSLGHTKPYAGYYGNADGGGGCGGSSCGGSSCSGGGCGGCGGCGG